MTDTEKTVEQVVDCLIKKGVIAANEGEYISFKNLQIRYDNAIKDMRGVYDMIKEGFPKPMQLSKQRFVWVKSEVEAWEEMQKDQRIDQERLATFVNSSKDTKPSKRRSA